MVKYSGQLYQLSSKYKLCVGNIVSINGPHDTFGVVFKVTEKENGEYLNLIKGYRNKQKHKPSYCF